MQPCSCLGVSDHWQFLKKDFCVTPPRAACRHPISIAATCRRYQNHSATLPSRRLPRTIPSYISTQNPIIYRVHHHSVVLPFILSFKMATKRSRSISRRFTRTSTCYQEPNIDHIGNQCFLKWDTLRCLNWWNQLVNWVREGQLICSWFLFGFQ